MARSLFTAARLGKGYLCPRLAPSLNSPTSRRGPWPPSQSTGVTMTFDPSNRKKGDSSRFASALVEVLEAADAVPRSVEQLGDATAIASEAMRQLSTGLDRMLTAGRCYLAGEPSPTRRSPLRQGSCRREFEARAIAPAHVLHRGETRSTRWASRRSPPTAARRSASSRLRGLGARTVKVGGRGGSVAR